MAFYSFFKSSVSSSPKGLFTVATLDIGFSPSGVSGACFHAPINTGNNNETRLMDSNKR